MSASPKPVRPEKLAQAAETNDLDRLRRYAARGVDWHQPVNDLHETPLMIARKYGHFEAEQFIKEVQGEYNPDAQHDAPAQIPPASFDQQAASTPAMSDKESETQLRRLFNDLDLETSGDGTVYREDLRESIKEHGKTKKWAAKVTTAMDAMPVDHDAMVTWPELAQQLGFSSQQTAAPQPTTPAAAAPRSRVPTTPSATTTAAPVETQAPSAVCKRTLAAPAMTAKIGSVEVSVNQISEAKGSSFQAEVCLEKTSYRTATVPSQGGSGNFSATAIADHSFSLDLTDITADLIVFVSADDQRFGRVIVPVTDLMTTFKAKPKATKTYTIFPLAARFQKEDMYNNGVPGVPGSAMVREGGSNIGTLQLELQLRLNKSPLVSYFTSNRVTEKGDKETGTHADGTSVFNPRVFKNNVLRLKQQLDNPPIVVKFLTTFPFSLCLLPIWVYLVWLFRPWHLPLVVFLCMVINGVVSRSQESSRFRWLIVWDEELPKTTLDPNQPYRLTHDQINKLQTMAGDYAGWLESCSNLFNFTDPRVSVVAYMLLTPAVVGLTVLLYFISVMFVIHGALLFVFVVVIIKSIFAFFDQRRNKYYMTEDEVRALRQMFDEIDVNGDGQLSLQELNDYLKAKGDQGGDLLDKVVHHLSTADTDGDGGLSWPEFKKAIGVGKSETFDLLRSRLTENIKVDEDAKETDNTATKAFKNQYKKVKTKLQEREAKKKDLEERLARGEAVDTRGFFSKRLGNFWLRVPDEPEAVHRHVCAMQAQASAGDRSAPAAGKGGAKKYQRMKE